MRDVCVVVELTDHPNMVSHLSRERTKVWLRTNQEPLSNQSDWF